MGKDHGVDTLATSWDRILEQDLPTTRVAFGDEPHTACLEHADLNLPRRGLAVHLLEKTTCRSFALQAANDLVLMVGEKVSEGASIKSGHFGASCGAPV